MKGKRFAFQPPSLVRDVKKIYRINNNNMKQTIRTFFTKIPLVKPLYHAAKRCRNILAMKSMQPVIDANHQNKKDIEKLIMRLDDKNTKAREGHLLKIESMLSEFYDAGILPKKECPVCGKQTEVFLPFVPKHIRVNRTNVICPHCQSSERHRCYWPILKKWFESIKSEETVKLLHFAPEEGLRANIEKYLSIDYWPVDIDPKYGVREIVDITDIPFKENDFDFIICNHVLEHVPDDKSGMSELHRVLKQGGKAMINVPIKMDMKETLQDERYNTDELRKRYYGHTGHVRQYGADFADKLRDSGFKVTVLLPNENKPESELKKYGLLRDEVVFICEK